MAIHALLQHTMNLFEKVAARREQTQTAERGAAMVEYGLLLVLVALAAFFTVQLFGDTLLELFEVSGDVMSDATTDEDNG